MQLKTKLILLTSLVVCLSYGVTFYRTSSFQEELVVEQATQQAKMLFNQIRLTRQWVSDHNGLFFVKTSGVESNPFLPHGEIQDSEGNWLVKRNPAMVTRELSVYAAREGMGQFNVTSMNPLNPDNAPDDFEQRSLVKFGSGANEAIEIEKIEGKHRLRYMAPLIVDNNCLDCHDNQGYVLGDIRGGMNVTVPMDWAYAEIKENNLMLLGIALVTIIIVSITIYLLFDSLVARRLKLLTDTMDSYPDESVRGQFLGIEINDEIGVLNKHFRELCDRFEISQNDLNETREQVFRNEKQAALGRLVAGISHEINNPLGGMQNCIQTMQRNMDHPDLQDRYLTLLNQGLQRIKETVRQLLSIGRKEPLEIKTGDLDMIIRDCFELTCVGQKQIELNFELGVGQPVTTGIEALRQVVLNLAGNAVQAIGKNIGVITVASSLSRDKKTMYLEISDTGPGIEAEYLDKIFEPFFTTKEVGEGTGLGLSVSHSLIKRLGGEFSAKNNPDKGACFALMIPLQQSPDNEAKGKK